MLSSAVQEEFRAFVQRIGERNHGRFGVAAMEIDGDRILLAEADQPFPLASTYKIAIGAYALHLADTDRLDLGEMIEVAQDRYVLGGSIPELLPHGGVTLSVVNLLELMLTRSDNTATDLLLARCGGPQIITAWLRTIGIDCVRVDRTTAEMVHQFYGIELPSIPGQSSLEKCMDFVRSKSKQDIDLIRYGPKAEFEADPRDQGTPAGMALLLKRIWAGSVLSDQRVSLLQQVMTRCATGGDRARALLLPLVQIAHKTGTIGGTSNDVGILTLPGRTRRVAFAILSRSLRSSPADRDEAIGQITRAICDTLAFS